VVRALDVLQEMLNHRQLSVACHFGSASKTDIESFIQVVVEGGDEYDSRLFQAHANDLRVARLKMIEFIDASFPEFRIDSVEGLAACRAELKRQSGLLLDRQITPATFCQFFNSMESELVISSDLSADEVAFLGDLFNACDWCDETWTLESAPYLAEEASRVASRIEEAEQVETQQPPLAALSATSPVV
jgi:hypothetical protein